MNLNSDIKSFSYAGVGGLAVIKCSLLSTRKFICLVISYTLLRFISLSCGNEVEGFEAVSS
jgi:hypothetical protein